MLYIFVQFVYFIAIGWWVGLLASLLAYVLCLTIIGIPLGTVVFNRLPSIMFLTERGEACEYGYPHRHQIEEMPFLLRVIWFFVLGWNLGLLALMAGYLVALTIIGIPLAVYILNRVPLVMTLSRRYA